MFRAHVLIIRRSKLHYTASGIITPIGWLNTEIKKIVNSYKCLNFRENKEYNKISKKNCANIMKSIYIPAGSMRGIF